MKDKKDTILTVEFPTTLMAFLIEKLESKSRDNIKSLLRNKQVWYNNHSVSQFNQPLNPGDTITIRRSRASDLPSERYLKIIYEDEHLIIIDKKSGLLSVTDGHEHETAFDLLSAWVSKENPFAKIYLVHRLDQYTSGLLMFVKNEKIQNLLRNNWKEFITDRKYVAVVEGNLKKEKGTIRSYLSENKAYQMVSVKDPAAGKLAITHYRKLRGNSSYSLVEVTLDTGKKNQIRVHMNDIGHPVAGDRKYGAVTNPVGRLCLHAVVLSLVHPENGKPMRFESDVPEEFLKIFRANTEIQIRRNSQR